MGTIAGYALIFFILAGIIGYLVVLSDSAIGRLDLSSNYRAVGKVAGIIKDRHLENGNFYDLGSAKGKFSSKIAKAFPGLLVYGIDNSRFRVFYSKLTGKFLKNLKFTKGDIFAADVSTADVVYLYLPKELMPELELKFQRELKPGAIVISNSVGFVSRAPTQTFVTYKNKPHFRNLYLYKFI